jgi:predicted DNA-binding protein (MmcQ/YjbR family)
MHQTEANRPNKRLPVIDLEHIRSLLLAQPGAEETYPFDAVTLVPKVAGKMFALLSLTEQPIRLTLKCDPDHSAFLRAAYPAIQPGYYMNKLHWITLTLDGSLEPDLVQGLIKESYRLVVASLPRAARAQLQAQADAAG